MDGDPAELTGDEPSAFLPRHFTRGKDGEPSRTVPPLTKESDRGDGMAAIYEPPGDVDAYAIRGREGGAQAEPVDLPNLRAHTGKDGGGVDGFVHDRRGEHVGFQSTLGSLSADGVQDDGVSVPVVAATPPAVAYPPRVMDASSTHGHEGVGTGMPNMSAENESLALTTRADRYAVFGELAAADIPLAERMLRDGWLPPVPVDPRPDGPRFAAMGDAVTVNVAEWIGLRLRSALEQEEAA